MKKMLRLWLFVICSTLTIRVHAAMVDANIFYFTDTTTANTDSSSSVTAYAFYLGFNLDKKGNLLAGWNYASYATSSEDNSVTIEYSSSQMGPGFVWFIDKDHSWRLFAAYNLKTETTYERTGSVEEDWRGTGIAGDLGYQLHFTESFDLGVRLNYSSSSFTEKVVNSTKTDVSYKKDLIYPSVAMTFIF